MIDLDQALDRLRRDVQRNDANGHAHIVDAVVNRLDRPQPTQTFVQQTAFLFACTFMALAVGGLSGVVTATAKTIQDDGPLSERYPLSANALLHGDR